MSARMSWLRGILPFVERTSGGIRMFKEQDYEWMKIIECMKRAGMPIKDIRDYIDLALEGDATIHERLQLFQNQKRLVQEQMKSLQHTLDVLDYKCWYYETAESAGTTDVLKIYPRIRYRINTGRSERNYLGCRMLKARHLIKTPFSEKCSNCI